MARMHPRALRRGAVAVQVVLCLTALLGLAALALDGGYLQDRRRQVQAAADAAAMAAADDLYQNYPTNRGKDPGGTAAARARAAAAAGGCANDGTTCTVTVNIPPRSGLFTDPTRYPGYVEVIVQLNQTRLFSGIWGADTIPVRARSVARGQWAPSDAGVLALSPSASGALTISGQGSLDITGGSSLYVDSNSSTAVSVSGGTSVTIASPGQAYVTGGSGGLGGILNGLLGLIGGLLGLGGGGGGSGSGGGVTSSAAIPDPLASLPAPDPSTLPVRTFPAGGGTIYPGRYIGGATSTGNLVFAGEGTIDPTAGNTPIAPGKAIYYFDGGPLSLSGGSITSTGGVMIYLAPSGTSSGMTITGMAKLSLTPLKAGTYTGMGFFQDRSSAAPVTITGGASGSWGGTFYAPAAPVTLASGSALSVGQMICATLTLTGGSNLSTDYFAPKANIRYIQLVE